MKLSRLVSVLVALKFRILDSRFDPLDFDFLNYALHAERLTGGVNGGDPSANGCPSMAIPEISFVPIRMLDGIVPSYRSF